MVVFTNNAYGYKSANPVLWHGLGLALSYPFYR